MHVRCAKGRADSHLPPLPQHRGNPGALPGGHQGWWYKKVAYTRQGLEDLVNNAAFRNCGLVPECEELNTIQGAKAEEEGDPGLGPALQGLTEEERADELRE